MKEAVRRTVAAAWAFRARVERDAAERFARLGAAISSFDAESPIVALMERAASDERRHEGFCAELAAAYGVRVETEWAPAASIVPPGLGPREAVLYEVVASCCITETESVATVATLLADKPEPPVRAVLHEIARDEVVHGRMGWGHLAREAEVTEVSFLARFVPVMLSGTVDDRLFAPALPDGDEDELARHGVLAPARKREIFVRTLEDVVFPGFERYGIDAAPARAWLAERVAMGSGDAALA